ncbi:UNVERIFIED_CONTAM: protein TORNADO 1 [Sesamum radiatum]|uniref:Protein TORNADO 1 n=1 Tax=Sesamum radiatum TaxID=300843 RepID=A0AAW2KKM0_SESRA
MATDQNVRDLQWALQVMKSGSVDLQSVSFLLSQPASGCFQETENSMNVNLTKDSISQFSQLLKVVGTAKNGAQSSLRNLEFHLVEWELQQVKDLRVLIENNPSIKQLMFRRNKFSAECLSELSDGLRKNKNIKEIMLSESGIGSEGAGVLASALKDNHSLEELQIWEDSIGSRGAEELSKMIEVNSTLKLLTIFDSKSITATPLISAVLARNRLMEVHIWSVDRNEKSSKVVEFVPENSTLRVSQAEITVAKEFRWVLEQNRTLKEVNLSKTCLKDKGVVYVAAGLFKNRSLERLYLDGNWFGGLGVEHLLCPLSKFSALQNQANTMLKSVTLGGGRTKIGRDGLAAILQMLTSNQSVTHLGIYDDESLKPDDIIKIFKSVGRNATLRSLSLQGCKGVKGELVLQTIMETLNVNPWIEDIDLARTPLQAAGKTEGIYQRLGQNERSEPEIDLLKDMQMTLPKSCRVLAVKNMLVCLF